MSASPAPIGLVIVGASGRMGLSLLRLLPQFPRLRLHAAIVGSASPALGRDSGELAGTARTGVVVSGELERGLKGAGLAIAFSSAAAAAEQVQQCAAAGLPLLLGTTGLGPEMSAVLAQAAKRIPLLVAPNTSVGASLLQQLVRTAAATLGPGFDIRILDIHHRAKADAPSGTALGLGQAAMEGGGGTRPVGYSSLRGGDVVGEHEVHFLGDGERLRLCHSATDRSVFARGALQAGIWLAGQPTGAYRMADIFK